MGEVGRDTARATRHIHWDHRGWWNRNAAGEGYLPVVCQSDNLESSNQTCPIPNDKATYASRSHLLSTVKVKIKYGDETCFHMTFFLSFNLFCVKVGSKFKVKIKSQGQRLSPRCHWAAAVCTMGSYASLSVCLSVYLDWTKSRRK